ncbi:MAG: hypothetical protein KBD15_03925 [Candidatus Magasanikbacteria bacterium]|nr:hypothetical protein [Candidatus Magasanikbacteria bacterium]
MITTINPGTQNVLKHYQAIVIGNTTVRCPYFNNKKTNIRGALRVLIGKGSPEDIEEEALLIGLREKIDLTKLDAVQAKKFLVDHFLGVDCSAFMYYMLEAEVAAQKKKPLKKILHFPFAKGLRRIIAACRPVENLNVQTLAHPKNSVEISLSEVQPGDMICMIGTGKDHTLDHVLIITEVETQGDSVVRIAYAHSLNWSTDGKYDTGIRLGEIQIHNATAGLQEQTWQENNKTGTENETLFRAKTANNLSIRRLKTLIHE